MPPSIIATIPPPPFGGIELGPFNLRLYGALIAIGAYLALRLTVSRYERLGGDPEIAERAALLALLGGFVGARIGYVIPRLDRFLAAPQDIFAIWQGGLVLFGGLAGGAAAVLLYCRTKRADIPAMADAFAPALPLAQAIGRWGNYFNQELYGRPTDLPWALEVEPAFRRPGFEQASTFHPTFLYESLWNATLVVVLLWVDRRGWLRRGGLFFVYLIGYGVGRAWIEALRVDTAERYLGWSRNNWIAVLVILIGVSGLAWWQRRERGPGHTAEGPPADDPAGDPTDPAPGHGDDPVEDRAEGPAEDAGGSSRLAEGQRPHE